MPGTVAKLDMSLDDLVDSDCEGFGKAKGKGKSARSARASPYEGARDRAPRRDDAGVGGNCRVFVGNLPYSATWQDLKDHMRAAGRVLFCDILPEHGTALGSKGCGLVEYATPAEAKRAIKQLTDTDLAGRPIFVREDREAEAAPGPRSFGPKIGGGGGRHDRGDNGPDLGGSTNVFVGNLAYSVSWQELKDHMRAAGNVLHCDIMADPGTPLGSKGCGLVQYETTAEARRAIRKLSETVIKGRAIFVREDREDQGSIDEPPARRRASPSPRRESRRERGDGGGGCTVFVGNLPYSATWKDLKDHMRHAGDVLHADIMPERGTAMGSKGCGLVEFASPRDARRAIRELTDTMLRGRLIFVREDRE